MKLDIKGNFIDLIIPEQMLQEEAKIFHGFGIFESLDGGWKCIKCHRHIGSSDKDKCYKDHLLHTHNIEIIAY